MKPKKISIKKDVANFQDFEGQWGTSDRPMGRRGLRQGWGFCPPGGVLIEVRDDELLRILQALTGERGQIAGNEN